MVKKYKYIDVSKENFSLNNKKVIIWGRALSALRLYVELQAKGVEIIGFTDSFVESKEERFAGLPVFTFEEIKEIEKIVIYISTQNVVFQREILERTQLLEKAVILCRGTVYGPGEYDVSRMKEMIHKDLPEINFVRDSLYDEKSVITFDSLLNYRVNNEKSLLENICERQHKQYFPEDEIFLKNGQEIFIDAGGYDGRTSDEFSEWVNGEYSKIYIMEPDKTMFHVLEEYVKLRKLHNVNLINKGAYSRTARLNFNSNILIASSYIDQEGTDTIQTISIDEMLDGEKATFIKMDIEGAEMDALLGAERTISKYRPKLAISIYHKEDDLWKLPAYIMKRYPWYRFYMRHYTPLTTETVLYATI